MGITQKIKQVLNLDGKPIEYDIDRITQNVLREHPVKSENVKENIDTLTKKVQERSGYTVSEDEIHEKLKELAE